MVHKRKEQPSATRRSVLEGVGAASVATLLGGTLPAPVSADAGDTTVLGDFESGLDGWRATGESELGRVAKRDRPAAVASGQYALEVPVGGDSASGIANETRVRDAEFVANPYLFATVTPGPIFGTDAAVPVRFRLHYETDGLLGDGTAVAESDTTEVRPNVPTVVTWDTSTIDPEDRANATRLEIDWSPEDGLLDLVDDDGTGADGHSVIVDGVHLGADQGRSETVRMGGHWERLEFSLGAYRETNVEFRTDHLETGEFVFADGSTVPYAVETLTSDSVRFVLDGVAYLLGGEWS